MNDETFINDVETIKKTRDRYVETINMTEDKTERSNILDEAKSVLTEMAANVASNYPNYGDSERVAVKAAIKLDIPDDDSKAVEQLNTIDREAKGLNDKTVGVSKSLSTDADSVLNGAEHDKDLAIRQWHGLSDAGAKDAVRFEYITRSVLPRLVALVAKHGKQAVLAADKVLGRFDTLIFPSSPGWTKTWLAAQPDSAGANGNEQSVSDGEIVSAIERINNFIGKDQFGRAASEAGRAIKLIEDGKATATRADYIYLYDTANM